MRNAWILAVVVACGKTTAAPPPEAPPPKQDEAHVTITGIVKILPEDPRHKVTPVEIVEDDGKTWLAEYIADDLWKEFDGRRIVAEAVKYMPPGQAIMLPHVHVEKWHVVKPKIGDDIVDVGPLRKLHGKFGKNPAPPDSKAALSTSPHFFEDGGESYPIAHGTPGEIGKPIEIQGRLVELSPFSAHVGGPHLWILP
jgi:hypothetical protein